MSYFYVNSGNPADVHELEERSPRLDSLPNWSCHGSREAALQATSSGRGGLVVTDGVLHRAGSAAVAPTIAPRGDLGAGAPPSTAPKVDAPGVNVVAPVDEVTGLPVHDGSDGAPTPAGGRVIVEPDPSSDAQVADPVAPATPPASSRKAARPRS